MNRLAVASIATIASALALLFTANIVFFLPLMLSAFIAGWTGMEQRFGDAEVN